MGVHSFAAIAVLVVVSCLVAPPAVMAGGVVNISTYWGTNHDEGSLIDACRLMTSADASETNLYSTINIGFVDKFGNGLNPSLSLSHCNPSDDGCSYLGREVEECHQKGIKVFISIGGPHGDYGLTSKDDATYLANYLWNAYLGGKNASVERPFGNTAILDGVDFFIEESSTSYWDDLAEALKNLSSNNGNGTAGGKMELSATPRCHHPDKYLGAAIQTGLFDYVQVRFYNETCCQYDGSFDEMKSEWDEWAADDKVNKLVVGVTANEGEDGYVDPQLLTNGFLSSILNSTKFGGVMVWYLYTDHFSHYSQTIKGLNSLLQTTSTLSQVN